MKATATFILALFAAVAASCNLMDFIPIGTLYGPDDYFFFTHRTRMLVLYSEVVVSPEEGKPGDWDFTVDARSTRSIKQEDAEGEDKEFFDAVCEKYGDVGYDKKELKVYGGGPDLRYVTPDIHSVSILSDRDYDDSHPAGVSLSDCFEIYAYSLYPRLDSSWREEIRSGLLLSSVLPNDLKMLDIEHYKDYSSNKYIQNKWICLMKLKVVKKPTLDKVHNLTFELQDEYGKTHTSTLSYDFNNSSN